MGPRQTDQVFEKACGQDKNPKSGKVQAKPEILKKQRLCISGTLGGLPDFNFSGAYTRLRCINGAIEPNLDVLHVFCERRAWSVIA